MADLFIIFLQHADELYMVIFCSRTELATGQF